MQGKCQFWFPVLKSVPRCQTPEAFTDELPNQTNIFIQASIHRSEEAREGNHDVGQDVQEDREVQQGV